jgi:hypothetical protein
LVSRCVLINNAPSKKALETDRRQMLLAMETGTGKTKLAITMLYRLLAAKRFRRICFVVDRNALGQQAEAEFRSTKVVSVKTFADIFGLKGLSDIAPESETKVHICTIQGLVKRVLFAQDNSEAPPIDQYDLMVVDECHRGYLLDRELADTELEFRSQDDYVSKYRRVLEYFDAVKIGLTATPALHTVQIFREPIFTYSYREAVIDGYLIDHEPPIRIETVLTRAGITFQRDEQFEIFDTRTVVLNFPPVETNPLRGLELLSGMILCRCALHTKTDRWWVGLPAKPYTTADGSGKWAALVDFRYKATRDKFQAAATVAAREAYKSDREPS